MGRNDPIYKNNEKKVSNYKLTGNMLKLYA